MLLYAIMEDTAQLNIRLAKSLLYDMEFVAQHYKISKAEWLKYKIANLVKQEREEIIQDIERRFIGGMISEQEFKSSTGINPTEEMKELRAKVTETPNKYIMSILEEIKKRESKQ